MGYASKVGRARVSAHNPQALGVCQRCGIWYNRVDLNNQVEWRGVALLPLNIYVCDDCYDVPQEQLRAISPPPDPVPVPLPLVEPFADDEAGSVPDQPFGVPVGLIQAAVMPLAVVNGQPTQFGQPIDLLSVIANGSATISCTTSTPHGLTTNDQVAVEGLADARACGFFSVVVTSATAFTYQTADLVPANALLTGTTLMLTCLVGLPYGETTIPQVG